MSVSNPGPGGVRNLRAMFENKASDPSTSPPSRGRSPNGSVSSTQDAPAGKVRASFVAVEKPGEEAQSQPIFKTLSETDTSEHNMVEEQGLGEILKGSPFLDDGKFPTFQSEQHPSNGLADRAAAMVKKMQQGSTEPTSATSVQLDAPVKPRLQGHGPSKQKSEPATEPAASTTASDKPSATKGPVAKPRGGVQKIRGIMDSAANAQKERVAVSQQKSKNEAAIQCPPTNKPSEAQPTLAGGAKPRGGVSKIEGIMESAKHAKEDRILAAGSLSKTDGSKDATNLASAARPPRSSLPAKKLPASVAAPTAPSGTRPAASQGGETKPVDRKPTKLQSRNINTTTASSLAKKSSRASLNMNEAVKAKSSTKPADEGFLARMMRPTASSAQKTHDKVQVHSPPRSRQTSGKTLTPKPSRKSLGSAGEAQDNETDVPAVPAIPTETEQEASSIEP